MINRILVLLIFSLAMLSSQHLTASDSPVFSPNSPTEEYPDREKRGGRTAKGTFTDTDGTGWNYCSGKCRKSAKTHKRAGGADEVVITVTNINCTCSCVLFKKGAGTALDMQKEFDLAPKKSGIFSIGQQQATNYTVRCCEED